ncbi:hypothetical protein, partial [Halalkalibacter flavus]|uniref:hypothetical protein n=1 Tax=Halalkalibacter flavus TaxID=3090668 RepID=UPI002FC6A039
MEVKGFFDRLGWLTIPAANKLWLSREAGLFVCLNNLGLKNGAWLVFFTFNGVVSWCAQLPDSSASFSIGDHITVDYFLRVAFF